MVVRTTIYSYLDVVLGPLWRAATKPRPRPWRAWGPLGSDFLSRTPGVSLPSKQVVTFVTKVGGSRNESTTSMPKLRLDNYGRGLYH